MSTPASLLTDYAPAPRAPQSEVRQQFRTFVGTHCRAFFDALPTMILALNSHRQLVFANQASVSFLGHQDVDEVLGQRLGDVLGCVNVPEHASGCGTSRHCRSCGAVQTILSAIDGVAARAQCSILRRVTSDIEGLDLQVNAAPIAVDGQTFVILAITDNSHETRRRSMERIFFHDVLNLAGGINGLSELLQDLAPDTLKREMTALYTASGNLVEEILAQRDMTAAEKNELFPRLTSLASLEILSRLQAHYAHASVAHGRSIVVDQASANAELTTDARLVQRVLGNMLKNALEAEPKDGTVRLSCREEEEHLVLLVHNPGLIPQSVQDSIFRRSFSTKGAGRGLGIYSMMLLTERYLHGSIGFSSTPDQGTVFFLRIPKEYPTGLSGTA